MLVSDVNLACFVVTNQNYCKRGRYPNLFNPQRFFKFILTFAERSRPFIISVIKNTPMNIYSVCYKYFTIATPKYRNYFKLF